MMAAKRRQDREAFNREAIRLVTEPGDRVSETARHLGLNAHRWGRWKRAVETQGRAAVPGHGRMAAAPEAWPRWRDDNQRVRRARDLFNKALGFLASGSTCGMPGWPSPSPPGRLPSWARGWRSVVVGWMRLCHATPARRSRPRPSSCEAGATRSPPTHVTGMALGVWPHSSRARGALGAERRRDGGCVRRGWWGRVPNSAGLSPPLVARAMPSRRTGSRASWARRGLRTYGAVISALGGRLRAGGRRAQWSAGR